MQRSRASRLRAAIGRALAGARRLDVASDFDGTLTPIVATPGGARLGAGARAVLRKLARLPGARVALLSGRSLANLERHVRLSGVFLAGLAGIETRDARGRRRVHLGGVRALPAAMAGEIRAWCEQFPGAWVEDKGLGLAIHDRALAPRRRRAFQAGLARRLAPYRRVIEQIPGKLVRDLRPVGAPDKGQAVAEWSGRRAPARVLIYLGDDVNDRTALARVRALGGFAIAVGRLPLPATHRLPSPRAAVDLLAWLESEWRAKTRDRRRR